MAEIGDLTRFTSPRQLMSYLGLVPSESSSGATTRRGGHLRPATATSGGCSPRPPGATASRPARRRICNDGPRPHQRSRAGDRLEARSGSAAAISTRCARAS
ncbi:transposase [Acidiferrobacter sp.]|uniref:transposase n=1 Tax=Acidiferrobacter sp. TaxID=1872107 RepID=UPI0034396ADB